MSKLRDALVRRDQLDNSPAEASRASGGSLSSSTVKTNNSMALKSSMKASESKAPAMSFSNTVLNLAPGQNAGAGTPSTIYQNFKTKIHNRLIDSIDVTAMMQIEGGPDLEEAIEQIIHQLVAEEKLPMTMGEKQGLAQDVLHETLGLGPLEPLLNDENINDILVNRYNSVWVDRNGRLEPTDVQFKDDSHLIHVINRIVARIGRRVDESSPIVDARLPDGSRVNAIIPPLALDGPILSIRRFRPVPFKFDDLIALGTISSDMAEFLTLAVQARLNILVAGGTSAGKTTLLNVLSCYISDSERIVTIEDTAELRLQQRHVLRLESRPANIEGQGAVTQRELVKNALRMRPDRIIVGEVRGPEALDMLQAMNTGHEGSLTTVHANTPRDALSRLETLVLMGGVELTQRSIREQIGSAFNLIVQVKRLADGKRRVVSVTEVTGVQEGVVSLQELFTFDPTGEEDGRVLGEHRSCGIRPQVMSKFRDAGIDLRLDLFSAGTEEPESSENA